MANPLNQYIGRFAPSPSGPLHAGSLVAAMASYLDAKAHQGLWLVRIEDIDEMRTVPGATESIMQALAIFGMQHDGELVIQSQRKPLYQAAFDKLAGHTYACACTRKEIADSRLGIAADGAAIYPGTCRNGVSVGRIARTLRVRVPASNENNETITFNDRWLGPLTQHLATEVGDFVLKRADGYWAYQLAVVVDDAAQGVTHVVRGTDLLESTGRQIYLQRLLDLPTPHYMHVPVVLNEVGEKLSKQTGAQALDLNNPLSELLRAARFMQLQIDHADSIAEFWQKAIADWKRRFGD
ncbi:tRNA glutamyl-Q(34) synthetase GluQRS [Herminiimonas fonticola]|uniref:Glutamyl-Q tRNA(Asp) synthetase n=1 Tax=Herminiimonas fonticola TaxID=303380 RepID=A0A4R6G3V9_9BURK|nr:tRNA glutamyl-Q(34) synthetase GluQRS [Herminiimonas fonticola]RBA23340.1 glutamyl-queuosine tRNA(Asp) synthetase [Herminiimonas fonticola]TDN89057.1 glutamyl-Q tRNA(Asp) synthetase [Herminiimonas fonticola]